MFVRYDPVRHVVKADNSLSSEAVSARTDVLIAVLTARSSVTWVDRRTTVSWIDWRAPFAGSTEERR